MKFLKVSEDNIHLLELFLSYLKEEKIFFRYFNSRKISIIKNHLFTYVITSNSNEPMCYGHIDFSDEKYWLGIVTRSKFQNRGLAKLMMKKLLEESKKNNVNEVWLSCDKINYNAIALYKKNGFSKISETNDKFFMKKEMQ